MEISGGQYRYGAQGRGYTLDKIFLVFSIKLKSDTGVDEMSLEYIMRVQNECL